MANVDGDPEVGQSRFLDRKQRIGHRPNQRDPARIAWLVFDAHPRLHIVRRNLAQPLDLPFPKLGIVDLERIVEAVRTKPKDYVRDIVPHGSFDRVLAELDCRLSNLRTRIGERPSLEPTDVETQIERRDGKSEVSQPGDELSAVI